MAAVSRLLGTPYMPWQQLVADVGGEIDPDSGFPAYREVIITVPRQNGKTTLVLAWEIQRAQGWGSPQRIAYSAQSGQDARKKLLDDQVPILEPRRRQLGIRRIVRANGNEAVDFSNGSKIMILSSATDAGHGKTIDLGVKDELFADFDDRRDQSLVPAMATRAAAQVLTISTMGTDESYPWNSAVERGRAAVAAGVRSGIAYFEWAAGLEDDPDDPETWWSCMPALGHTITEGVVAHARRTLKEGEFRRAFLNQQTKADDRVIPAAAWAAVVSPTAVPRGALAFALDVNPERTAGAIVAASGGAVPVLELVDYQGGVGWLVGRAKELSEKHGPTFWLVDGVGPAASLIKELEAAGLKVFPMASRDLTAACGQFFDAVMQGEVKIRKHQRLELAAAAAIKRFVGDSWAWTRKNVSTDVSPLVAATLALHGSKEYLATKTVNKLVSPVSLEKAGGSGWRLDTQPGAGALD